MGSTDNISITPVNVLWQQAQTERFEFKGKTGSALGGKYVILYPTNSGVAHYAFFTTGSSTDPAPAGMTKITVTLASTDTATQIATKFAAALNGLTSSPYAGLAVGTAATVKRVDSGDTLPAHDGAAPNASGVVITQTRRGRNFDLGLLQGDVALNFEPSNFSVTAHQTGVTPRASLFQGFSTLEATTTLLETATSNLETIYNLYGGSFLTAAGNKVFGVGSSAQGKNLLTEGGRLILRPVNATDHSQDVTMMLAIPVPGALTFSGENPRTLEITWQGFIDQDFNSSANAIAFGDLTGE